MATKEVNQNSIECVISALEQAWLAKANMAHVLSCALHEFAARTGYESSEGDEIDDIYNRLIMHIIRGG